MNKGNNLKLLVFAAGQLDKIGGVQRSYQILINYLIDQGWDITLCGLGQELKEKPSPKDLAYVLPDSVKVENLKGKAGGAKAFAKILALVENVSPNVILVVNSAPRSLLFMGVAKYLDIPLVYSMRGSTEYCLKYLWPCREVFNMPFKVADAIHLLMPSYLDILSPKERDKVFTIPSQIEPATSFASPGQSDKEGRYKLIYSGRLSFEKQLHYLIEAFSILAEEFPEWDLQIIGNGPLETTLQKQSKNTAFSERIEWLRVDNTEAMYELYPKAHLKVLPSEYEGCPMALREAMAHGLPVIAYDTCTGSNEIIEHGIDGLLASASEPVSGLANAMRELMANPQQRVELGKKGIEKATRYLPEPINKQWEALLLSAIETRKNTLKTGSSLKSENQLLYKLAKEGTFNSAMIFEKDENLYQKYRKEFLTIYGHRLFDDRYYLEKYLDVKLSGKDPLLHYISEGWIKGYNPSLEFSTIDYQRLYMDDSECAICPLYHFYTEGAYKGFFPISVDDDYFEKWPNRKPEKNYSIVDDLTGFLCHF
ncbi:glycosyltransferase [Halomonas sp. KRD171]|uniref:glycosyltransferase n=1 Tax=Halomonas sp. KRD171 TaxID=2729726 RepID=UPI0019CF6091|nr:glycosyltransferase [Halomonas sp. KRD171]